MASFGNDEINTKALDALNKTLKDSKVIVRVGILGGKNVRNNATYNQEKSKYKINKKSPANISNAEIGAAHEFGTTNLPVRSFLRMPIAEQFPKELTKAGIFNDKDIQEVIKNSSFRQFANKIGVLAVRTVLMAFDSAGFGKWKESNMHYKKVKQTLVETHQLRDSITFDVKSKK